jgi:SAM-dependent methyltransferase
LSALDLDLRGRNVLCLAARQGTEVRAFVDRGAFAVGIDLNPGRSSRHVLTGDFHDLQFADASVDVVFTNSLDHAFDLERLLGEVRRVLKPGATFLVEANLASDDGGANSGAFESLVWEEADALLDVLEQAGFRLASRASFDAPWTGEQLVLRRAPDAEHG